MNKYIIERYNRISLEWTTVQIVSSLTKAIQEVKSRMRHDKTQVYRYRSI